MKPQKSWLIVLVPLLLLAFHFPSNDLSKNDLAEKWGRKVLAGLPQNAVLLVYGDIETFLFGALRLAYKIRPDIAIYSLDESFGPLPGKIRKGYPLEVLTSFLEAIPNRPVYHFGVPGGTPHGWENISDGFLYLFKKPGSVWQDRGPEAQQFFQVEIAPRAKNFSAWEKDLVSQAAAMIILNMQAKGPLNLKEAKNYANYSPFGYYLLGRALKDLQMIKKSIELAEEKNLKPPFQSYLLLGWSHFESQNFSSAKRYAQKGLSYNVYSPDAYFLLAKIALIEQDLEKGREYLSKTLQLNPQHKKAKELLVKLETFPN